MVYRIFVEKKSGFTHEANAVFSDVVSLLKIKNLNKVRVFNRYDVENIDKELFDYSIKTVFSEPQLDDVYNELELGDALVFAVEYLPGQFDQGLIVHLSVFKLSLKVIDLSLKRLRFTLFTA